MQKRLTFGFAPLLAALFWAVPAWCAPKVDFTMDFEQVHDSSLPSPYVESGGFYRSYTVESLSADPNPTLEFTQPGDSNFTGSIALSNPDQAAGTMLTRNNGVYFEVLSIDISEFDEVSAAPITIEFVGTLIGGFGTVTQQFTTDGVFGFETFVFDAGMNALDSFTWSAPLSSVNFQVDNVVLTPEPGTGLLLGAGLVAMAIGRRRSARQGTKS